jgi:hypothetical protein
MVLLVAFRRPIPLETRIADVNKASNDVDAPDTRIREKNRMPPASISPARADAAGLPVQMAG